jgi:hypothetical protein
MKYKNRTLDVNNMIQIYLDVHKEKITLCEAEKMLIATRTLPKLNSVRGNGVQLRSLWNKKALLGAYKNENGNIMIKRIEEREEMLSMKEAANRLFCTPGNVYILINNGRLPIRIIGKKTKYLYQSDIDNYNKEYSKGVK